MNACMAFFIFSLLFASCADNRSVILPDASETLRARADGRDAETPWTRELEAVRLAQNIASKDGVAASVKLTPQTVVAAASNYEEVFPFLNDFGSLDTSLIFPEMRAVLDSFVQAILHGQSAAENIADGCLYSYVFFIDDMQTGWKQFFGSELPEHSEKNPLFTTVLYGAPFISEDGSEIPVRFEYALGGIDVSLCFENEAGEYKINQIEIIKWRHAHGD